MKICNTNPHAMLAIGAAIAGICEQPFTSLERTPKRLRDDDSETRKAMAAAGLIPNKKKRVAYP